MPVTISALAHWKFTVQKGKRASPDSQYLQRVPLRMRMRSGPWQCGGPRYSGAAYGSSVGATLQLGRERSAGAQGQLARRRGVGLSPLLPAADLARHTE